MKYDIVYLVKNDDINHELRYSLRSLKNIPHASVIIAGHKPSWVKNVIHIETDQKSHKYANSTNNLIAACNSDLVEQDFILMNDDFFIMKPLKELPVLHRGSIDGVIQYYASKGNNYHKGMIQTRDLLVEMGIRDIKSYELHVPMLVNKGKMLTVMKLRSQLGGDAIKAFHKRTFYGNYWRIGGETQADVKIHDEREQYSDKWEQMTFMSTLDRSFEFGAIGRFIREKFSEKSEYEI